MGRLHVIVAVVAGALLMALAAQPGTPAQAQTTTVDNPWTFQMTNPGQGLVIVGPTSGNTQLLELRDYLGNPIFVCNAAGGCAVLGDDLSTFGGGDVFNPTNRLLSGGGVVIGRNGPTLYGTQGNPAGACSPGDWALTKLTGRLYACVAGVWVRRAG